MSTRAQNRTRGQAATRKRQREFARGVLADRQRARADARETFSRENPNAGKRHAARLAPARENSGQRRKTDPRIALTQTRNGRELPARKNLQPFEAEHNGPRLPREIPDHGFTRKRGLKIQAS